MSFEHHEFSIDDASTRNMKLPGELQIWKASADEMRSNMENKTGLRTACELTDSAILRTKAYRV